MAAGPAPSESRKACHPRPPREQGRQEVSGCPSRSSRAWPAHGCWRLIRNREPGRSLRVAGYVTFGSLVPSEVSLPLCGRRLPFCLCPGPQGPGLQVALCVIQALALPALLPSAAFCPWLLGDAPGRVVLELWQAGLLDSALCLAESSVSSSLRLFCGVTWLWSAWLCSSCGREAVGAGRDPS